MILFCIEITRAARCSEPSSAKYNVTFIAKWSIENFPKQYPLVRPHAQWTQTIGRTHSSNYVLYRVGDSASPALKEFAQSGYSEEYTLETQGASGILDIFSCPKINRGVGSSTAEVFVDNTHSLVSFVSRMVPSPDWFTGISDIDLCGDDGHWVQQRRYDLGPLDAGTDKGMTFTAPNWPEIPQAPITEITAQSPNHPANSFFYPDRTDLPPLATVIIHQVSSYVWNEGKDPDTEFEEEFTSGEEESEFIESPGKTQMDLKADMKINEIEKPVDPFVAEVQPAHLNHMQDDPVDCVVSDWTEWGPCSKTCGFGNRSRQRKIIRENARSGTPCPELAETELCGSMRNCKWTHFKFGATGNRIRRPSGPRTVSKKNRNSEPRSDPRTEGLQRNYNQKWYNNFD